MNREDDQGQTSAAEGRVSQSWWPLYYDLLIQPLHHLQVHYNQVLK